jgi:hypothetical protein
VTVTDDAPQTARLEESVNDLPGAKAVKMSSFQRMATNISNEYTEGARPRIYF